MKDKIVYLVRHGESEGNVTFSANPEMGWLDYSSDSPLTENGKMQSEKAAEFLDQSDFDVIISSPFERAKNTAEIINKKLGKQIIFSDLCIESEKIPNVLDENSDKEDIHRKVLSLRQRVFDFLEYLENRQEEKILIVTHGFFMRAILIAILHGHDLENDLKEDKVFFYNFLHGISLNNTGVSVINYKEAHKTESRWKVQSWNNTEHLK